MTGIEVERSPLELTGEDINTIAGFIRSGGQDHMDIKYRELNNNIVDWSKGHCEDRALVIAKEPPVYMNSTKQIAGLAVVNGTSRKSLAIEYIYVGDGYRGRKIGSALLSGCVEHAIANQKKEISLKECTAEEVNKIFTHWGFVKNVGRSGMTLSLQENEG